MKHLQRVVLLIVLTALTFACKKDDDPTPLTRADMLMGKKWRITSLTLNTPIVGDTLGRLRYPTNPSPTDWYNNGIASCEKDDIISFKSGNLYALEDVGTTVCGPQIWTTGTWILSADETSIQLGSGAFVGYYTGFIENWVIKQYVRQILS